MLTAPVVPPQQFTAGSRYEVSAVLLPAFFPTAMANNALSHFLVHCLSYIHVDVENQQISLYSEGGPRKNTNAV